MPPVPTQPHPERFDHKYTFIFLLDDHDYIMNIGIVLFFNSFCSHFPPPRTLISPD